MTLAPSTAPHNASSFWFVGGWKWKVQSWGLEVSSQGLESDSDSTVPLKSSRQEAPGNLALAGALGSP